jgi:hypothetical protein
MGVEFGVIYVGPFGKLFEWWSNHWQDAFQGADDLEVGSIMFLPW